MPEHTDSINLDKIVFDDENVERRWWSCLGQTCSRSLIVFLYQFFVILLIVCGCFWRIHLTKICDESTVRAGILCSAAGYIYLHQSYEQVNLYKKPHSYVSDWTERFWQHVLDT